MITKISFLHARKSGLPIFHVLPPFHLTLANAKQMGIVLSRKKDAYLQISETECVAIWNLTHYPVWKKPIYSSYYDITTKNLFTKQDAKQLTLPVKKEEKPAAFIRYHAGRCDEYIPLYERHDIPTQMLVRRFLKSFEMKKVIKERDGNYLIEIEGNAPMKQIDLTFYKKEDGHYFAECELDIWAYYGRQTSDMAFLLALCTKLFTGKERLRLLVHGFTVDTVYVPYKKTHNPHSLWDPKDYISLKEYLNIPLY